MKLPSIKRPNLAPRELRILVITVAIAFLLLNHLVVVPWWNQVVERSWELRKDELDVQRQGKALQSDPEWRRELSEFTQHRENRSPHVKDSDTWKRHINLLADENNVNDFKINRENGPESKSGAKPTGRVEARLRSNQLQLDCDVSCGLKEMVSFLHALQMDPAYPRIESCSLGLLKQGEEKLKGKIVFSVFLKPAAAQ